MRLWPVAAVLVAAPLAFAQPKPPAIDPANPITSSLKANFERVQKFILGAADEMPAADYAFKPSPDVRSFGELVGHLANEHYLLCAPLKGEANPMEKVDFEKTTAKADLVKAINESIAYCDAAYAAAKDDAKMITPFSATRRGTPFTTLLLNVTHDNEHYGNMITYLRMKGIVPPSSTPTR